MDLWIRSQDKELLANAKAFELQQHYENSPCQIFAVWNNNFMCIGVYKTKERAIEILDEIQNILKPQLIIKNSGKIIGSFEDTLVREGATYVYQMPEN